jgi:hypothetical protein
MVVPPEIELVWYKNGKSGSKSLNYRDGQD